MRRTESRAAALLYAALVIIILLLITSKEPAGALSRLIGGPLSSRYSFGNMLSKTAILSLCGAGMAISLKAGSFNLGGEGQIYFSSLLAAMLAIELPERWGVLGIMLILVAGAVSGGLIAAVSGILRYRFRIHELISSFLLSGALVALADFLISGPLRDTESFLQRTEIIPEAFHLDSLLPPSNFSAAVFIAAAIVCLLGFWLFSMRGGYELRVFGENSSFSAFGDIPEKRNTILPITISGACYGTAGVLLMLTSQHAAVIGFTSGYGWNGITAALISGMNPIATIPASLLLSWIESGVRTAMSESSLSLSLSSIIRGIILLFITSRAIPVLRRKK